VGVNFANQFGFENDLLGKINSEVRALCLRIVCGRT